MEETVMHEDLNMRDLPHGTSAFSGFLLGAVVGAGLALLLAPATGQDTRRRIGETARRLREDARHRVDQARGTISELKEDARAAVETGRDAFKRTRQSRTGSEGFAESDTEARPV
jgi:gas vesicle protein